MIHTVRAGVHAHPPRFNSSFSSCHCSNVLGRTYGPMDRESCRFSASLPPSTDSPLCTECRAENGGSKQGGEKQVDNYQIDWERQPASHPAVPVSPVHALARTGHTFAHMRLRTDGLPFRCISLKQCFFHIHRLLLVKLHLGRDGFPRLRRQGRMRQSSYAKCYKAKADISHETLKQMQCSVGPTTSPHKFE